MANKVIKKTMKKKKNKEAAMKAMKVVQKKATMKAIRAAIKKYELQITPKIPWKVIKRKAAMKVMKVMKKKAGMKAMKAMKWDRNYFFGLPPWHPNWDPKQYKEKECEACGAGIPWGAWIDGEDPEGRGYYLMCEGLPCEICGSTLHIKQKVMKKKAAMKVMKKKAAMKAMKVMKKMKGCSEGKGEST